MMIVNIMSGDGLVPSGNKPLSEPMLTLIYVAICRHQGTLCLNNSSIKIM